MLWFVFTDCYLIVVCEHTMTSPCLNKTVLLHWKEQLQTLATNLENSMKWPTCNVLRRVVFNCKYLLYINNMYIFSPQWEMNYWNGIKNTDYLLWFNFSPIHILTSFTHILCPSSGTCSTGSVAIIKHIRTRITCRSFLCLLLMHDKWIYMYLHN